MSLTKTEAPIKPVTITVKPTPTVKPIHTVKPKAKKAKGSKAKTAKPAKVSINLVEVAAAYTRTKTSAAENLVTMRDIGLVLVAIRADYTSTMLFGQFIAESELSIMTRQDRDDATWLAKNWDALQTFKAEADVSSNSVGSLRKLMTKAKASNKPKATAKPKAKTEPKQLDIVELTEYILELVSENGLKTVDVIKALQSTITK